MTSTATRAPAPSTSERFSTAPARACPPTAAPAVEVERAAAAPRAVEARAAAVEARAAAVGARAAAVGARAAAAEARATAAEARRAAEAQPRREVARRAP